MDKKISISQLKEVAQEAYEQVKGNTETVDQEITFIFGLGNGI